MEDAKCLNWTSNNTKIFIDLYQKYKDKVGSLEIRTLDKLFEIIATELNELVNGNFSSSQCRNKWRVLVRAYKKYKDNNSKTGRGRHFFEFSDELDKIFYKKKNVNPVVLLDANTITSAEEINEIVEREETNNPDSPTAMPQSSLQIQKNKTVGSAKEKTKSTIINRNLIIEKMRQDKKEYYQERLKIEKEKVAAIRERNDLIRERNEILKNSLKSQ